MGLMVYHYQQPAYLPAGSRVAAALDDYPEMQGQLLIKVR